MRSSISGLVAHVDHFGRRVIQDAMAEATATYWRRRAEQYRTALPRPGDLPGRETTTVSRAAARRRIEAIVAACEAKALVIERYGLGAEAEEEIDQILGEVA